MNLYPEVPYQFFVMLPYLLAIGALVFMARSAALPRALGGRFATERVRDSLIIRLEGATCNAL